MNLPNDRARLKSKRFQEEVEHCKGVIVWWKDRYGYSNNDPRYLTATLTQVLQDALEFKAQRHIAEFESFDHETNEHLKRMVLDPNYGAEEKDRMLDQLNKALGAPTPKQEVKKP